MDAMSQTIVTILVLATLYALARRFLHFRAWSVFNIKTNPHACWRSDRQDAIEAYNDLYGAHFYNKIEDFCLMVRRVHYNRDVRVKLIDGAGDTVFASRVWVARKDLTPAERLTGKVHVERAYDANGGFLGVKAGERFMLPASNLLDGVDEYETDLFRYISNVIPEMIVTREKVVDGNDTRELIEARKKADRDFVEKHFKRAARSYRHAYGRCVPLKFFLGKYSYDAEIHRIVLHS